MNGALVFSCEVDTVVVGGGIAGLWLASVLSNRGYRVLVLEADSLGCRQTLASQGMVHGGLKYALGGSLTRASEAIGGMPARWRACLEGAGEIDLRPLTPLAEHYYLFADASALGRLAGFFASKSLRGRITKLSPTDYPPVFREPGFNGVVYALNDLVLDTRRLLTVLQANLAGSIYRHELRPAEVRLHDDRVDLQIGGGKIVARQLILSAGAGTEALAGSWPIGAPPMQLRPLHQVLVRHRFPHPMYAHCLTGIRQPEPRLTITSHADGDHWLWYLGGQLASSGVERDAQAQIEHARRELKACVGWIPWQDAEFSTLRIDRAEPRQPSGQRPDEAFAAARGRVIICWPTKLSLVPDLADKVLPLLAPPAGRAGDHTALPLPVPAMGRPPWER